MSWCIMVAVGAVVGFAVICAMITSTAVLAVRSVVVNTLVIFLSGIGRGVGLGSRAIIISQVVRSCVQLVDHVGIVYVDWIGGRASLRPAHCARRTVFRTLRHMRSTLQWSSAGGDLEYHFLLAKSGSSSRLSGNNVVLPPNSKYAFAASVCPLKEFILKHRCKDSKTNFSIQSARRILESGLLSSECLLSNKCKFISYEVYGKEDRHRRFWLTLVLWCQRCQLGHVVAHGQKTLVCWLRRVQSRW
ncbi:hypothetical protein SERLA73DRAFT_152324 [Serpula lacrymans var. lacrymans S7.3]|uniref:Uncharacterized protein n=1 Tax=Serpula lacrymans var. lacrymans (strain S7.3) TaxID=936435 RepID=F8PWF4_SERL3|nr:hypothetical protein SERLA73DRAFT_152324 [Serpula lacrymans var. lacrymans S7.3]